MKEEFYSRSKRSSAVGFGQTESETSDFYQIERQIGKTAQMISFVLKTGTMRAFPVIAFEEITFKPERGITLYSRKTVVTIEGRNLNKLYAYLTHRRVNEIREFSMSTEKENHCFIAAIKIDCVHDWE
jgi:hypothetical protein